MLTICHECHVWAASSCQPQLLVCSKTWYAPEIEKEHTTITKTTKDNLDKASVVQWQQRLLLDNELELVQYC